MSAPMDVAAIVVNYRTAEATAEAVAVPAPPIEAKPRAARASRKGPAKPAPAKPAAKPRATKRSPGPDA